MLSTKSALLWTLFWIANAAIFNGGIYYYLGTDKAAEFASAYIVEKLLSFDNLFVFMLIFSYFKIENQRALLNYGLIGAVVLRGLCIFGGIEIVESFHWVLYIFGALLIWSGIKIFKDDDGDDEVGLIKYIEKLGITPWVACLITIELSDILFAVDSIPAVLSITQDRFIAYSSNIFAILGLRSLYFLMTSIDGVMKDMQWGIGAVLIFIGAKMLIPVAINPVASIVIVVGLLTILWAVKRSARGG